MDSPGDRRPATPRSSPSTRPPQAAIGGLEADRLKRGQPAVITTAKGVRGSDVGTIPAVLASLHGEAVAICELDGLKLKPLRVFNAG